MPIILALMLLQLYVLCISAMVTPVTAPVSDKIWDLQHSLEINAPYKATMEDAARDTNGTKSSSSQPAKNIKRKTKTMTMPAMAHSPIGWSTCTIALVATSMSSALDIRDGEHTHSAIRACEESSCTKWVV
ncbi:hypothetical protein EK21DRAFT_113087 [Setomelanomma holmii]|uniref:Secreted protein n=1 Tax=Setomelanomma holmii TaxID=210430 RepID=A0A9P4LJH6_9PLEO|nr:hypothetical protein EK21DRAFT_113087 [Setomelanomma holmii]